jgi:hypothetical protein
MIRKLLASVPGQGLNPRERTPAHQHLLGIGYIEEHAANKQELLISVTEAGRQALRSPP